MVKGECSSYKDRPVILNQIQTSTRTRPGPWPASSEARRSSCRTAYSFDVDTDGLAAATTSTGTAYIDLRAARHVVPDRRRRQRRHGRQRLGAVPRPGRARRGHVRASARRATTRRTPRPPTSAPTATVDPAPSRRCRCSTPLTRPPSTSLVAGPCSWATTSTPSQTLRTSWSRLQQRTARTGCSSSACPATARSTSSGSAANVEPAEVLAVRRLRGGPRPPSSG